MKKRCLAGLAVLLLVSACASHQAGDSQPRFASEGYVSADHETFISTAHAWRLAGREVRLTLARPERRGAFPVVIYMPGLGESSEAGRQWGAAWASAGYAVLTVQLLEDDATAWGSELARQGEFKTLGRQRFAPEMVGQRVLALANLVAEGRRRSSEGEPDWQGLDWSRTAIAGFDLGAHTALTAAGGPAGFRAALALSPYVTRTSAAGGTRYDDMALPVMSITGPSDVDVLGLVEDVELRELPFDRMPGPDKFLLTLDGLPHSGFSGNVVAEKRRDEANRPQRAAEPAGQSNPGQGRRGGNRGRQKEGEGGAALRDQPPLGADVPALSTEEARKRVIAVQAVSTAFLDACLKGSGPARAWLADGAQRWIAGMGELRRK